MPDHFINEVPVVIAGTGEGLLKILEAAKDDNALAIIVLVGCALSVGYVAWSVIKHLLPTPKTARWRRWRTIGLISLFCFPLSCVAFWIWIKDLLIVFFAPLVFVCRRPILQNHAEMRPPDSIQATHTRRHYVNSKSLRPHNHRIHRSRRSGRIWMATLTAAAR